MTHKIIIIIMSHVTISSTILNRCARKLYRSVTQTDELKPSTMNRRRYRYVCHTMCGVLSIAIIKRVELPRVKLTYAKLGKCAKLSRAKLASRRSGTRPTGPRQTRTRQKGRAKLDCNPSGHYNNYGLIHCFSHSF